MNKVCNVKPDYVGCCICRKKAEAAGKRIYIMEDCPVCEEVTRVYEILSFGYNFNIGDYAMLLAPDRTISKVAVDRIYDVEDKW